MSTSLLQVIITGKSSAHIRVERTGPSIVGAGYWPRDYAMSRASIRMVLPRTEAIVRERSHRAHLFQRHPDCINSAHIATLILQYIRSFCILAL